MDLSGQGTHRVRPDDGYLWSAVLVDRLVEDGELRSAIDALVLQKRKGLESDVGPRIEPISRFIEEQIVQAGDAKVAGTKGGGDAEVLNVLFRSALKEFMGELA